MVEASLINGMILFIIISAQVFTYIISSSGLGQSWLPGSVFEYVRNYADYLIMVLYLILGCFLDGIT